MDLTILLLDLFGQETPVEVELFQVNKGIDKHLDLFGITVLASVVGVGGRNI